LIIELEDQKNTQQELQTVLNNRLNGTIVALWTAISYDAYNKPKSILYGNGSLTRNIYSMIVFFGIITII
jgi:hypothetical protein